MCPECQRVGPKSTVKNPLIPMPIIETPFDRIALDIVGPLPKTSRGHRYILVLVDYATRYPEALTLRAATAKAVARELMFSRVGIAREVLTDQGSCFMSCVMRACGIWPGYMIEEPSCASSNPETWSWSWYPRPNVRF